MALASFRIALLAALFLGPANAAVLQTQNTTAGVRRVMTLLREMLETAQKEGTEDTEAYDKYKCWCETSEAEKTKAVEDAQQKIADLEAFLEESKGKEGELKTQIAQLEQDIAEDKDALASAQAQRAKEAEAFAAEEADLKDCLGGLTEAIAVLSKVQFLQKGLSTAEVASKAKPLLLQLKRMVQKGSPALTQFRGVMQKDFFDVLGALGEVAGESHHEIAALAQRSKLLPWEKTDEQIGMESKPNDLVGMAAGAKSYNSRSGVILGMLKQMGSEFGASLAEAQKAELEAMIDFHHLTAAKVAEIAAATKEKDAKETELAELGRKVAEAKEDLEATKETLAEDQKFLVDLEKMCTSADEEYAERVKIRTEEIRALNEVIAILTSDDARDLFGRTVTFLQLDSVSEAAQRQRVERALSHVFKTAGKNKDWVLAALAIRGRLDKFTKVREIMDKMLAELQAQQKAEYEKWEKCKADLDTTDDQIKQATWDKEDLEEKKLAYENAIEVLKADIEQLNSDIADMEVSLKRAGEDRKAENQLFQTSVSDSRATVQILKKALARLQQFYNKKALVQVGVEPPPPRPKEYQKSAGAGGVMQVLSMVIEEAERGEVALVADEKHAQESYASLVEDTRTSIEANRAAVAEKSATLAETEGLLSETEEALLANAAELARLDELLLGIHQDCDWLLKYFDIRQTARKEEMNAIVDAKAILAGAK